MLEFRKKVEHLSSNFDFNCFSLKFAAVEVDELAATVRVEHFQTPLRLSSESEILIFNNFSSGCQSDL